MKNLKYFPFERNKYFYGKLLSVADFETEQKYMNDKRRMANRFIQGSGVVCGLDVLAIDDITISIEKGLALDYSGREIVVDEPITKKISMIDGFESYSEKNSYVYLCLEYGETEKEPVHSISNSKTSNNENIEYNKVSENYTLHLTTQEPEVATLGTQVFYEDQRVIYQGNGVSIKQVTPLFATSGKSFEVEILVEKTSKKGSVSFEYDLETVNVQGSNTYKVSFDESDYKEANKYSFGVQFEANQVVDAEAKLQVVEKSFKLKVGGKKLRPDCNALSTVKIVDGDPIDQVIKHYYTTAYDRIVRNNFQQSIYLAKMDVIKAGSTYIIDSLETMPFDQYIVNQPLITIVEKMRSKHVKDTSNNSTTTNTSNGIKEPALIEMRSGTTTIDMGIGAAEGQKFYTEEIVHGLGIGPVTVVVGESVGAKEDAKLIYGDAGLFNESDVSNITTAVKVEASKGSFVVGVRFLSQSSQKTMKLRWTAYKDLSDTSGQTIEHSLFVNPDMVNLNTRDTFNFEGVMSPENSGKITWRIKEDNGGTIDQNGMYTAPNHIGVFEVIAESEDYPDVKASAFVVVRDKTNKG